MTIKKLEGKERFEAYKLAAFSFHKRLENIEEEREKREAETLEDWGAFDDDGNLMARVFNRHYDFYLDGQAVKTGGHWSCRNLSRVQGKRCGSRIVQPDNSGGLQ